MRHSFKNLSIVPKGLRYKTMIAFSLTSLIPLLICGWLVITYIFPNIKLFLGLSLGNISFILVISVVISLLGLYVTKQMIDPVIKIADDVRVIASGDVTKIIEMDREDEIGDLSKSLNIMTQKIKDNMDELKTYGEKTKTINIEINKKVLALSGLLQIGNLISSSAELDSTLSFILEKISDLEDDAKVFLLLVKEGHPDEFNLVCGPDMDAGVFSKIKIRPIELSTQIAALDSSRTVTTGVLSNLGAALGLRNIIMMPLHVAGRVGGAIFVGNNKKDFVFAEDEQELLNVFVKQITIAVENSMLLKRARELAIKDELTGLYNENYTRSRLDEEIKRAMLYQRPCGYLLIDVDNFKEFHGAFGETKSEMLLRTIAEILKLSVTEVDRIGRLKGDKFAVVMPEKNKKQAAAKAEEIRKKVEEGLAKIIKTDKRVTVSIGVSENPIDGSSAEELIDKAERLMRSAKSLGKNRVVV
ncbi:MAG: diguanylate cyclase [Candidatus Omnitrophota bacterium]